MGNPIETFLNDWTKAKESKDQNSPFCTLVTVSKDLCPSARIVGLREVTQEGEFLIFLNRTSPKWKQLQETNKYELLVFWPSLMIQYRISGSRWSTMDDEEMKKLWVNKPHRSKLLDYYYQNYQPQSSELDSRQAFLDDMKLLGERFPDDVPRQETNTAVLLQPAVIEEWRGDLKDRLHHRCLYELKDGEWIATTLVP